MLEDRRRTFLVHPSNRRRTAGAKEKRDTKPVHGMIRMFCGAVGSGGVGVGVAVQLTSGLPFGPSPVAFTAETVKIRGVP